MHVQLHKIAWREICLKRKQVMLRYQWKMEDEAGMMMIESILLQLHAAQRKTSFSNALYTTSWSSQSLIIALQLCGRYLSNVSSVDWYYLGRMLWNVLFYREQKKTEVTIDDVGKEQSLRRMKQMRSGSASYARRLQSLDHFNAVQMLSMTHLLLFYFNFILKLWLRWFVWQWSNGLAASAS